MLKIIIQIKEESENNVKVGIKQISEKEFNKSTQNEKITASEIKNAIEAAIYMLKNSKKEGEENEKES